MTPAMVPPMMAPGEVFGSLLLSEGVVGLEEVADVMVDVSGLVGVVPERVVGEVIAVRWLSGGISGGL